MDFVEDRWFAELTPMENWSLVCIFFVKDNDVANMRFSIFLISNLVILLFAKLKLVGRSGSV